MIPVSKIPVSKIILGTMTWGEQNTPEEGFAQMDMALDHGVHTFDAAELYPTPPRPETYGKTEEIIGQWFKRTGKRDKVFLCTKVIGRSPGLAWIRGANQDGSKGNGLDRVNIRKAIESSLRRLGTDYVDLYQFHWPDRRTNFFGKLGYEPDPHELPFDLLESLQTATDLIKEGKIRHIGLSNETPWGLMKYLALAEKHGLPRVATIQNPYSLLNRSFEVGLAEIALREQVPLLAYSPLGFGMLTGKYDHDHWPAKARLTLFGSHFKRYLGPEAVAASLAYNSLARDNGLDPAQMALAWCLTRPFVQGTIIGATNREQLQANLQSVSIVLSAGVLQSLEDIHRKFTYVAP